MKIVRDLPRWEILDNRIQLIVASFSSGAYRWIIHTLKTFKTKKEKNCFNPSTTHIPIICNSWPLT